MAKYDAWARANPVGNLLVTLAVFAASALIAAVTLGGPLPWISYVIIGGGVIVVPSISVWRRTR